VQEYAATDLMLRTHTSVVVFADIPAPARAGEVSRSSYRSSVPVQTEEGQTFTGITVRNKTNIITNTVYHVSLRVGAT
jgi:hypothetical protein